MQSLIFFIKVFGGDLTDHSGQDYHRYNIGEGHEGIGHISDVPDDIEMRTLDVGADEEQDDEGNPVRIDDPDAEDVLQTFFAVIAPAKKGRIAKQK